MLINDKLYKLVNGEIVELTTDDIPEGASNKYSAGGVEQLLAVLPWEPLPENTLAYQVSDGTTAYAVTTGSYPAYQVSDGDKVYHVTTGDYTAYQVSDGDKSYEISTGNYTAYGVSDGATVYEVKTDNITVYEVTNGPAAYAIQTEEFTSYQVSNGSDTVKYVAEATDYTVVYNEKELLTIDETVYETPLTYTGTTENVQLTGYADDNNLTNATFFNNVELTNLMSFGYKQKEDFSLVDGTKINGTVAYVRTAGSIGEENSATMYSDTELTNVFESSDTFKYNGNSQNVQLSGYVATLGDSGTALESNTEIYKTFKMSELYVAGGVAVTEFKYTGETARGHNYYTDQSGSGSLTTQKIYSDTLLREEITDLDATDFTWSGTNVENNIQTCYIGNNTDIANEAFYTTNKLSEEYIVKGAKTKNDFSLTGEEFFGHTGYVENSVFTEIYSDIYLRELVEDYTVSDFSLTDVTETVSQQGWSKDESITAVYTTEETDVLYEIKGAKQLSDFYRDGQTAFGHLGYVATNSAIDTIYSDVLLTTPLTEGELGDFEYTGTQETAAGQNAYVATAGTINEYLVSQIMYTTKYLDIVFNPTGAKTTQSFYYTGTTEMGHIGYVKESGTGNLTTQTIYTDTLLLTELNAGVKTDYSYTGSSSLSERSLAYQAGDKFINSATNQLGTYENGWIYETLNNRMGYIVNNIFYYYDNVSPKLLKTSLYKNIKEVNASANTIVDLEDHVVIYKINVENDVNITFTSERLTQSGYYEFEVLIDTSIPLTSIFSNNITWAGGVTINSGGKYLFKIRVIDASTWLGELEASWV